jgi:hypothetical protein
MKKIKIKSVGYFLCASMLVCLVGCDDNNSLHQKYIDRGETFYTGKVDSLKAYPGNERVKFTWGFNSDPRITKTVISWNDGKESAEIPVSQQGIKKMETILNIPEGIYSFKFATMDSEGHSSLGTERTVQIYGPKYISYTYSQKGRRISGLAITGSTGPAELTWTAADEDLVRTVLKYESASGAMLERDIPNGETRTTLPDIRAGSAYSIYSYFLPAPEALDLLLSVYGGTVQ